MSELSQTQSDFQRTRLKLAKLLSEQGAELVASGRLNDALHSLTDAADHIREYQAIASETTIKDASV